MVVAFLSTPAWDQQPPQDWFNLPSGPLSNRLREVTIVATDWWSVRRKRRRARGLALQQCQVDVLTDPLVDGHIRRPATSIERCAGAVRGSRIRPRRDPVTSAARPTVAPRTPRQLIHRFRQLREPPYCGAPFSTFQNETGSLIVLSLSDRWSACIDASGQNRRVPSTPPGPQPIRSLVDPVRSRWPIQLV